MGIFNKMFNSSEKNRNEVSQSDVDQIMGAYSLVINNSEALNCQYVMVGPYWTEYNGVVLFGSGAIAVGISDYEDRQINAEFAERMGFEIRRLQGRTYAQIRIGSNKSYSKKQKAATIDCIYKKLQELYPEGFPHVYDNKQQVITVIL